MIVGLTGGIGSGKSTVLKIFKRLGCRVISADEVAHEILKPKTRVYYKVIKTFGKKILNKDKTLNRKKLAEIIFSSPDKRRQLDNITHPVIINRLKKRITMHRRKKGMVIVDVPLLFEASLTYLFDKIVLVYASQKNQIQRLKKRTRLSVKEIKQRIKAQSPLFQKKKYSDYVIDNKSFAGLYSQIKKIKKSLDILQTL